MSRGGVNDAPPAAQVDAPRFGGILQDMLSGAESFAYGSSTYHTVNAVMAPHTTHQETLNLAPARGERPPHATYEMCKADIKAFRDCLYNYRSDNNSRCEYYADILAECIRKCNPDVTFSYGDEDDERIDAERFCA